MRILSFSALLLVAAVFGVSQTTTQLPSAPSASKAEAEASTVAPAPQAPAPAPDPTPPAKTPDPATTKPTDTNAAKPTDAAASNSADSGAAKPADTAASKPADPPATPDTSSNDDTDPVTTIKKVVQEVNVVFTVSDKHGHFVKDLKQNDFKVLDDRKPPTQIVNFASETNLPLRVGLLIDASNSIRDRFRFEQDAAIEFLNEIIRQRYDRAFVIGFDTTPEVTQEFTDNTDHLSRGVRALRPGGGTALYDAVYFACRDKLMKEAQTGPTRRAIILLSDGEDNQSRVTREEAIEMAQRAEVIIYAISTNVSGVKMRGDKVMERMAEATGGRAFFPFRIQDVSNAFSEIQDELRSQYVLAYKPADFVADGHFRSIDIMAADRKGLQVRARKGYFAPKP
jgi:VWFA-related protein